MPKRKADKEELPILPPVERTCPWCDAHGTVMEMELVGHRFDISGGAWQIVRCPYIDIKIDSASYRPDGLPK